MTILYTLLNVRRSFIPPIILVQPVASIEARALFLVDVVSEYPKGKSLVLWSHPVLVHAAIDAVDREDEDFIAFVKISPNNLVEKIQVRNKKEKSVRTSVC